MISLSEKSIKEFKQLNDSVPELFRLSAKVQLAETISFNPAQSTDSVNVLINSCLALLPNRQFTDIIYNDNQLRIKLQSNPTLMSSLISIRSQESVIALSHLYKCSNGVIDDKVILILLAFLVYLTYSDFQTNTDIENSQNFIYYLVRQLAILSHLQVQVRDTIVPAFVDFFTNIVQDENVPLITGTLMALGDQNKFLYQQDELTKVLSLIESIMGNPQKNPKLNQKKILLLICKSYEHITYLPQEQVESDTYKKLYHNVFPYTSTLTDNETFVSIINVIVRCGLLDASIGKEVFDYIIRFIQETKNLSIGEVVASLARPNSELLYMTMLQSFVDLCDKYSDKATRGIEVLKEFITNSLVPKHSNTIRLKTLDCVCSILKNEHQKEGGVEICKTVIGSLINTLHMQYSEYTSNAGLEARNRASRSPSVFTTSSLMSGVHSDSLSNIIVCLGRITCTLDDPNLTEIILPNFMSRVTYPPNIVENLILDQLTDIALLGRASVTKDIVVLIIKLFKKIYRDPNQGVITNITPDALRKLAAGLVSEELRHDLCKRVLKLFQQLGKTLKKEDLVLKLTSPILKGMGFLLPTIAALISNQKQQPTQSQNIIVNSNQTEQQQPQFILTSSSVEIKNTTQAEVSNVRLFRSIWFYCVLLKFAEIGAWRSDWRESVQIIASNLMPLISTKTHLHLEMELELDSIIKQGFEKDYYAELRNKLMEYLPNHISFIKNLTFPQIAYVYSVYSLETMRFSMSHSFKVAFAYLEDQSIENVNVTTCLRAIVDKVFNDFITTYIPQSPSMCEEVLSDHASFLLVRFCYPYQPVRTAADDSIIPLVAKFPQILWNKDCLATLLDLIEVIGQAARSKPMDLISIRLPSTDYIIELPDETPARHRLLHEVVALGNVWLKNGAEVAPIEIQEQLQEYMQKFNQLSLNHIGFSLAVEIGSIDNSNNLGGGASTLSGITTAIGNKLTGNVEDVKSAYPVCYNSNAANFVSTLQLKALYSGEVNGMINMMMMDYNENPGEDTEKLSEIVEELAFVRLIEEFEKIITKHKAGQSIDGLALSSIMYRSCAFLINHYFGQSVKLIHMVCYTPAFIFTQESMQIGITSWKWLLAERPDLTEFIMTSVSDIWSWTVNQKIGLFSRTERDPSPLAITNNSQQVLTKDDSGSTPANVSASKMGESFTNVPNTFANPSLAQKTAKRIQEKHNHLPHKIMISFLEERFSVVKYTSKEQINIIVSMLLKALGDPFTLNVSPKSLATRFKLLLLCMKLIQGDHISDGVLVKLMRERVYMCALGWFFHPPVWYGQNESSGELEADTKVLIDFCKALQQESIFQYAVDKRFTISGPFREKISTGLGGSGAGTPTIYNTLRNGRPSSDRLVTGTLTSAVGSTYTVNSLNGVSQGPNNIGGLNYTAGHTIGSGLSGSMINNLSHQSLSNLSSSTATTSSFANSIGPNSSVLGGSGTIKKDMLGTMNGSVSSSYGSAIYDSMRSATDRPLLEPQLEELRKRRNLILLLVGNELERMSAWNNPINRKQLQIPEQLKFSYEMLPKSMKSNWREYLVSAWKIDPRLAIHFSSRFQHSKIRRILSEMVVKNTKAVLNIPEALPLLVTEENVIRDIPELKYLLYWESVTPPMAISFLGKSYHSHPLVTQYACRVLRNFQTETIMFYIPQLVQALRYDKTGLVENYLVTACKTEDLLAHQIIWNIQTYTEPDPNTGKMVDESIHDVAKRLKDRIISEMDEKSFANFKNEFNFFESFTAISGHLLQNKDPTKRKAQLREELKSLSDEHRNDPDSPLYMPTNPKSLVIGLDIDSAMTLQSAAKVPILVNFKVKERLLPVDASIHLPAKSPSPSNSPILGSSSVHIPTANIKVSQLQLPKSTANLSLLRESNRAIRKPSMRELSHQNSSNQQQQQQQEETIQGCIFKSGDDIRQDMLALQVIDLFKRIFKSAGLDLYLFPYKVIATKPGCGMIELVPNTMSRDQIGKKVNGSLYDYFISRYGHKNSVGFQNARRNFIKSMAAYSVVSYILQIKDRHNANILVDDDGHVVHIDFGFIFDISPGGDMITFEASPFKMSQEMIDIMGGKPNAEQFTWFMEQSVRAFLAARQHMDSIITLVELMLDTKLPCFKEQTILHLRQRFCPFKSETYAAKFMTKVVVDSFSTISTYSTYFYDIFQYVDNGIYFT